jgi:enamine deaminase RidA (YjgF/YER057c/UK114 family)
MSIVRIRPTQRWSDIVVYQGQAHFVEVPNSTDTDIFQQTKEVLQNTEKSLKDAGSDITKVCSLIVLDMFLFSALTLR